MKVPHWQPLPDSLKSQNKQQMETIKKIIILAYLIQFFKYSLIRIVHIEFHLLENKLYVWGGTLLKKVIDSDFAPSLWHGSQMVSNHAGVHRREPRAKGGFQYRGNGQ